MPRFIIRPDRHHAVLYPGESLLAHYERRGSGGGAVNGQERLTNGVSSTYGGRDASQASVPFPEGLRIAGRFGETFFVLDPAIRSLREATDDRAYQQR